MVKHFSNKTVITATPKTLCNLFGPNTTNSRVIRNKSKVYKKYTPSGLRDCVLGWVLNDKRKNMMEYCRNCKIPRATLQYHLKEIPELLQMMSAGELDLKSAEDIYDTYVKQKDLKKQKQLELAHHGNQTMDEDEEGTLANLAMLMATSGRGITRTELLELMNLCMSERFDHREYVPATMKSVYGFLQRNNELQSKVRSASSIDPARAAQASKYTRDCMFTKLNSYVVLMHELKICKEKTFSEFKSDAIYNMDELALDTTRRSRKVLCSKDQLCRLFMITPKGDDKMNMHISIALTTRADGKLN